MTNCRCLKLIGNLSRNAELRKGVAFVSQAQSRQDPSRLGNFSARRFFRLAFLLSEKTVIFLETVKL